MKHRSTTLLAIVLSALAAGYGASAFAQKSPSAQTRSQVAVGMFQERCKRAGEKIYETVENVEGISLMKLRPRNINYRDQFKLDDPYGADLLGDGYIVGFLRGSWPKSATPIPGAPPRDGYLYVEAVDQASGARYRYTGSTKIVGRKNVDAPNVQIDIQRNPNFDLNIYAYVLDKSPAPGSPLRYGVTYDDISTREEREYWIAGSSLRVVDLQTNKVMAERVGYMIDLGQGADGGGRSPWLLAANNACPGFQRFPSQPLNSGHNFSDQPRQTQDFVEKVLKPKLDKK